MGLSIAMPTSASAQVFSTIYNFCSQSGCPDGSAPNGWLVQGDDGSFYGTTSTGGANGFGTVFKISRTGTLTPLHSFNNTDGNGPSALIRATDGNFYGTTSQGGGASCSRGANACGTIFRITPDGTLTTLYTFCTQTNCPDGFFPVAALMQARDGNLYGTTSEGGQGSCEGFGCGTVFKITLSGTLTTLYKFCSTGCSMNPRDGANPSAALVQGPDGNFYGTTAMGGGNTQCTFGCGTLFRLSPNGMLRTLHAFNNSELSPTQLIQAIDGNLYGMTTSTLFEYRADGVFSTLHTFTMNDGYMPLGMLQATDGNLYGTTSQGGNNTCVFGCGTVFRLSLSGVLTTLHIFNGTDGAAPMGGLVEATDGSFFGTTSKGGSSSNCQGGCGTVFKMTVGLIPFLTASPTVGNVGDQVTILGTALSGATGVAFNGTSTTYTVVSDSKITATVPAGSTTGRIEVTKPGATLFTFTDFQVLGAFQFIPVTPCRVLDTRLTHQPIVGGTTQNYLISQLGGCGIPNSAAAYSLNVTIVPYNHQHLNYVTVWPEGEIRPNVSLMNSSDGRIKANAAIVPSGNNAISIFSTDTTDVILDINGYFAVPGQATYQFYAVTPCRIVDTRGGHNGGTLQAGVERDYAIPPNCGIPSYATAYSFNVTVLPTQGELDFLTVWPQGEAMPNTSTLNDYTGTIVANAAIVPAGPNNTTAFEPFNKPTDLLLDVNGYFAPAGAGGLNMYPTAPCRVLDTRQNGSGFSGQIAVNVVGSSCAPPSSAMAYIFNATVVPPGPMLFLELWPDGEMRPTVSTLNAQDGAITSNMAIVPTNNGSIDAYAYSLTQLILDISGYFSQ